MKKCEKCGFETKDNSFKFCPKCGEKISFFKGLQEFEVTVSAEESYSVKIKMTYDEAKTLKRVFAELADEKPSGRYEEYASIWIEDFFDDILEDGEH